MSWLELSVAVTRDRADTVSEVLQAQGAVAVSLSAAGEEVLLEPLPGSQPLWHHVRLEALFAPDTDLKAVRSALEPLGARLVDAGFIAADDWQQRWRAHAVRACFAGRLWLLPRDEPFDPDAGAAAGAAAGAGNHRPVVLRLDPGLAFGTGSHPTTRLCLAGLAARRLDGLRVLDFGCGSGILALAACLLGAAEVVAVDHDPQALVATRENAAYNRIASGQLTVLTPDELFGPDQALAPFDLVVANILANPLIELAPSLCAMMAPGGEVMLSGLLADQADAIRAAYAAVDFAAPVHEEEWIRLDGRR
jgi:ribosomal protein L11 methyltransferase